MRFVGNLLLRLLTWAFIVAHIGQALRCTFGHSQACLTYNFQMSGQSLSGQPWDHIVRLYCERCGKRLDRRRYGPDMLKRRDVPHG